MIEHIHWLGHGSFYIDYSPGIYICPWRVVQPEKPAGIILIGHDHYDHCSVADISKIRHETTSIIGNKKVQEQLPDITVLRPWQSITVQGVNIKTLPAYSPDGLQHPREDAGLGFVISLKYYDIYYAGDSGLIPEMERISPDIAILPIDDDGTMSIEEAVEAVDRLRPRWVYPANWGATGEGVTLVEAREFQHLVGGRSQVILPGA